VYICVYVCMCYIYGTMYELFLHSRRHIIYLLDQVLCKGTPFGEPGLIAAQVCADDDSPARQVRSWSSDTCVIHAYNLL
jgi:hypothetical protein